MTQTKLPKESIFLNISSPSVQNDVIDFFKKNGIPVFEDTKQFDIRYPFIYWDAKDGYLCQTKQRKERKVVDTVEEFFSFFFDTVKLTSQYNARIVYGTKTVQVGCQEIPFEKVLEVAKLIQENS